MLDSIIDLSHHNTITDFQAIKDSGVIGIIHKASESMGFKDSKYFVRKNAWLEIGGLWGAYHFIRSNGVAEANRFLDVVNLGENETTLLALDYEDTNVSIKQAEDFVETINEKTGKYPVLYIANNIINYQKFREDTPLLNCPLWIPRYGKKPNVPSPFSQLTIWQYTENGKCAGISGNCDRNYFMGNDINKIYGLWNVPYPAEAIEGQTNQVNPEPEKGNEV